MSGTKTNNIEGVIIVALVVGYVLWFVVRRLSASRPDMRIGGAVALAFALRVLAFAGVGLTGVASTLRGGDETTFLAYAQGLAHGPLSSGLLPHGKYQLQTVLFSLEDRLGFMTVGAMRVVQIGIALLGVVLIVAAVYDLAGGRAARLAAWLMALEPASLLFNSALHKEPNMELAAGLVVFGGTMIWKRLDYPRGVLLFALAGFIAVETRSYAGWFLVAAAVLVLLHASLRSLDRPMRAMPAIYAVVIGVILVTPTLLAASSHKNLQTLQASQTANATGAGEGTGGPNGSNLALEQVDFSTRGAIVSNLPKRILDLTLKPYPWQLGDSSQRFGAIGTLVAYAVLFFFIRYAWRSRGQILPRAGPVLWPLLFLLAAYSLAVGNAGTGFRYRTHLVTLAIAGLAILREQAALARARKRAPVRPASRAEAEPARQPSPTLA